MTRKTLVVGLLLAVTSTFGQKLRVKENHGEVFKAKGADYYDVFRNPNGGYFSVSYVLTRSFLLSITVKSQYYIQQFDDNMNLIKEVPLNLGPSRDKRYYFSLKQFGDKFYVFTTKDDRNAEKRELYYAELDVDRGEIIGGHKPIAHAQMTPGKGYTAASFNISISKNKKYLIVFAKDAQKIERTPVFSRNVIEDEVGTYKFGFTFWLFDDAMKEVMHEKDYTLKIENSTNSFYVQDYEVDNEGSIYILGKNAITDRLTRKERKETKQRSWLDIKQSAFVLQKISPDGSSEQQVTPEELLYLDMDILFDEEGNINLVGLVGEQVYYKLAATGVNRLILSADDLSIIDEQTSNFTDEVLKNVNNVLVAESNLSDRKKKRVEKREEKLTDEEKAYAEITKRAALNVNNIAYSGIDEKGNVSVVLEEYYVQVVTTTTRDANGGTTTTTTYYYHYDDLFLIKFFDDDVVQNSYKKAFTTINVPLDVSISVTEKDEELTIVTPKEIVRADVELDKIVDYDIKAMDYKVRVPGLRKKMIYYKKVIDENTILAPAQFKRKVAWYKFEVN